MPMVSVSNKDDLKDFNRRIVMFMYFLQQFLYIEHLEIQEKGN